jgi:hypothetical protein
MEFHGSVRHHQVSSSVGRCRRGDAGSIWVHGVIVGGRSEGRRWGEPASAGRPAAGAVPELEVEGEGGGTGRAWRQGDWRGSRHGELRSDFRRRSVGRRCNYGEKTTRFAANHESWRCNFIFVLQFQRDPWLRPLLRILSLIA